MSRVWALISPEKDLAHWRPAVTVDMEHVHLNLFLEAEPTILYA